jgi:Mrp family chromosome partitioning ATPase/predicted Fe-Mo cluster-binding NifX family protein
MSEIAHKYIVLSGKGGVGKSSIAVNLAVWLSTQGKQVGLLDADIHGPSVPKLLAVGDRKLTADGERIQPIECSETLKGMSVGFLLPDDNEAVIWRGPMKHNLIQQFVQNVEWGPLDCLVVDCPPGTGDEPLSVVQVLGDADGAIVVTTPQELAAIDVRKCLTFCRQIGLPVLGIIENMSGFVCPHCNKRSDIFAGHSGEQLAAEFNVPFLGCIPIDPSLGAAGDRGKPFVTFDPESPTAQALMHAFSPLLDRCEASSNQKPPSLKKESSNMRIAVPLTDGLLSAHFGHCEQFAILDIDAGNKHIQAQELVTPPPHEPGLLPKWLAGMQVNVVIAGGMGQRAQQLFTENGIEVLCGAPTGRPEELVMQHLEGRLELGRNACDH